MWVQIRTTSEHESDSFKNYNSKEPYDLIAKSLSLQWFSSVIPFNKWPRKTETLTIWTTYPKPVWQKYLIIAVSWNFAKSEVFTDIFQTYNISSPNVMIWQVAGWKQKHYTYFSRLLVNWQNYKKSFRFPSLMTMHKNITTNNFHSICVSELVRSTSEHTKKIFKFAKLGILNLRSAKIKTAY